jgi:glyoxylase-like metal-dependent hydrolase (beta-lactamase superfamily II)
MTSPQYSIELFRTARHYAPSYELYWMDNKADWVELNFLSAIVRGGDELILINTGLPKDYSEVDRFWRSWDVRTNTTVDPGEYVLDQLKSRGIRPEQITRVLVTPLTVYATGNLHLFPNARVGFSKRGWIDFQTPDPFSHQLPRSIVMPDAVHQSLTGPAWSRLSLLGEDESVIPGIRAKWVGTHHRGSMAYVINTKAGRVALTDCVFKYPNIEARRPLGIQESMEECLRAYDWLRREADVVVPLYDPEVFARFPEGKIG